MRHFVFLSCVLLTALLAACAGAGATPTPASPSQAAIQIAFTAPDSLSTLRFKTLGVDEGLSENTARAYAQDHSGFLWIGTEDGLNRYDGYQFKIYRPLPGDADGLSDRWINDLFVDQEGYLWVATRQGGLNRYDSHTDRFLHYRHIPADPTSLASDNVRNVMQDSQGMIWAGTADGLDRLDPITGAIQHFRNVPGDANSLSGNIITALLPSAAGSVWVGTSNAGLNLYEPSTGTFVHFRNIPEVETSLASNDIQYLRSAPDGSLWLGTSAGLVRLNPRTGQASLFEITPNPSGNQSSPTITALYVARGGELWIGTNQGLFRYDEQTGKFINYAHVDVLPDTLNSNYVVSIFEDREGVLWVGTFGGGINQYNRAQDKFKYYRKNPQDPQSLASDIIFNFFVEPSGVVWVATVEGLDRLDPAAGKIIHHRHDPSQPGSLGSDLVWIVFRDSQGKLWAATQAGLDQLDESTGQFIHFRHDPQDPTSLADNAVYFIYEDKAGELWLGTGQGLDRYERQTGKFIHFLDPNDPSQVTKDTVIAIQEDAQGRLWVGTFSLGLFRLDQGRQAFTYYQNVSQKAGSLSNNTVMAIHQDRSGTVWVATTGGLNKYLPESDSFKTYTVLDGLPNDVVYAVLEDGRGSLWLSTNFGISRFTPAADTFHNYSAKDGLQGNEFNQGAYAQGPDGSIYFGGVNGFNVFSPQLVEDSPYSPPVALTGLTFNGKPLEGATPVWALDEITLQWPQDSFEFDFTALSFTEPQDNQYAYRLDGLESSWNEIGSRRSGRYTNLPGGTYTLLLKASNGDGVWNEAGRALRVTVIAPFWKTGWFYGLLGLLALGCVAGIYRLRIRNMEGQKRKLERLVNQRTAEIEHLFEQNKELAVLEERNRLARELHDSAKQKAFASLAQMGTASSLINQNAQAARKHLSEAENLVYEVIQELTFLIQEMYPIALKEKGLPAALREYVFEWETRTDIRVNLQIEGECPLPLETEQAIYRIVQEALANIARHSQATRVEFLVRYLDQDVEVLISDDGQGFDLAQKPNGIGLRSISERARSVGGTVEIQSAPGQGTQVTVKVPATRPDPSNGGRND
jgi:two-component system, sensor histidine kinase ChiS